MVPDLLTSELNRIPLPSLARLKQNLGLAERDVTVLTREEKVHIIHRWCIVSALTSIYARRYGSFDTSVTTPCCKHPVPCDPVASRRCVP